MPDPRAQRLGGVSGPAARDVAYAVPARGVTVSDTWRPLQGSPCHTGLSTPRELTKRPARSQSVGTL